LVSQRPDLQSKSSTQKSPAAPGGVEQVPFIQIPGAKKPPTHSSFEKHSDPRTFRASQTLEALQYEFQAHVRKGIGGNWGQAVQFALSVQATLSV